MKFLKEHRRILTAMYNGLKLEPMKPTQNCMEDGFALTNENNGLKGFSEVLSSTVIFLQERGYLDYSSKTGEYFITLNGKVKIGVAKRKKKTKKKVKEGA